ncbi:hypothetical protein HAX54_031994, partial [Datura stramonium]|nr:hypothetical protein [Datura stramonium]
MAETENTEPSNVKNNMLLNAPVKLKIHLMVDNTSVANEPGTSPQASHHYDRSETQNDGTCNLDTVRVARADLTKNFLTKSIQYTRTEDHAENNIAKSSESVKLMKYLNALTSHLDRSEKEFKAQIDQIFGAPLILKGPDSR